MGIIPHQWESQSRDPYANFNTWHKCCDVSNVKERNYENEIIDTLDGSDMSIPLDAKNFAMLRYLGF